MAVQAQYPSNVILPDFRSRVRQSATNENRNLVSSGPVVAAGSLENAHLQPVAANLLRDYSLVALQNHEQQAARILETSLNVTENHVACSPAASRKRPREVEELLARQHALAPIIDFRQTNRKLGNMISPARASISTGLRLALEDNHVASSAASTSERAGSGCSLSSIIRGDLQSQMLKQSEEIDQFIKIQGEHLKQALEEKRQRHTRALIALIEEKVFKRLKEKDAELDKVNRRSLELEERLKKLSLESQLWQNLARNHEAIVCNLKSSLEQVVAQTREQSKEGCGEIEVEDAESCHYGETAVVHARTFQENKELKEQRTCRVCRANSVCILLLPCRHLCLCKDCERRLDICPICRSSKNASVQVYMS